MTTNLPNRWARASVGDVCRLVNGRAFKPSDWAAAGLPIVRIQNLNDPSAPFNRFDKPVDPRFLIDNGELLFAWSGTPGTSFGAHIWNRGKAILNQHIYRVLFDETLLNKRFLQLAINSRLDYLIGLAHGGAGLAHVTKPMFEATELPIAPLNEQHRIVARLEELLTRVDAAQARLANIPRILKRFRQSVLAAACSGDLTADWRQDNEGHESADSLFQRIQQLRNGNRRARTRERSSNSTEEIANVPPTWKLGSLDSLCDSSRGITYGVIKLGAAIQGGIPCLRTSDVKPLRIDPTNVKRISPELSASYRRTILKGNEVLVNVRGTLGGVAVVPSELKGWNVSREVAVVPLLPLVDPKFIAFWIASIRSQDWLSGVEKGVAYTGINLEDLRLLPTSLPPLPEQKEIVRRIEGLFKTADALEARYRKAKAHVDKLTQSILAKAFRGELVPQNPNDEPAAVLLEKLRLSNIDSKRLLAKRIIRGSKLGA